MEIEISEDGFIAAIRVMEEGVLVEDLDRQVAECVQAIQEHGGKAELTLKIKIARIPNMDTAVGLTPTVITKIPKPDRPAKVLFVTKDSGLTDQYQKQDDLDLGQPIKKQPSPLQPVSKIGAPANEK